jgi:rRNA biogenesis protein RRP5
VLALCSFAEGSKRNSVAYEVVFVAIDMSKRVSVAASSAAPSKRPRPASSAEAAFPRGGGSSLTPLEYRAAVKSADGDVLFSSKSGASVSSKTQANRQSKQIRKDSKQGTQAQEAQTRKAIGLDESAQTGPKVVESLKYKFLTPGSKILCAVSEISESGITVSLPNCLTGTVTSEHLPNRQVPISQSVSVGDTLCACVVGLRKDGKKNVLSLSLVPSDVSSGITADNILPDQVVQGVVRSLEDHGAVLDIGIPGCTAFFPQKFFHHISKPLCVGCIIRVSVESVNASRAVVKCCLGSRTQPIGKPLRESDAPSISTFMPGQLLKAKVTSVLDGGVIAVGPGGLYVTIDSFHVDYSTADSSLPASPPAVIKTGDSVLCRLTFVDKIQHRFCASTLKHLVTCCAVDYAHVSSSHDHCIITLALLHH